jgi:hypothetical protein
MELSPSSEATSSSPTQQIANIFGNPKVHYRVHNSPPLVPALSQINPVHTHSILSKNHLIIIPTTPRLPSGLFPSGFSTEILYTFLFLPSACYMSCKSHPAWFDHSNYIWRRVQFIQLLHPKMSLFSNDFAFSPLLLFFKTLSNIGS